MKIAHALIITLALLTSACSRPKAYTALTDELRTFVADKDATIGIALIIDSKDTVSVNGHRHFPMLSVYKLPIALALADKLTAEASAQIEPVLLTKADLRPDTYSPLRDRYASDDTLTTTLDSLLAYSLQLSDNNASDVLLAMAGGSPQVMSTLARQGLSQGIKVSNSEHEMHLDPTLCYSNSATPVAMATLLDRVDTEARGPLFDTIKKNLENCTTGTERLSRPLKGTGATIGHKTGTGFILPDGRLMAVNDAAYVHLPDGHRYTIAVFIENSGYSFAETEALIAAISEIALKHIH
ncbi:MAG: class A beta-lactamase-related serine hydrolase [Muribaculaceae bacterium]|nr:class A beta-lactamase-related serine hydrolase [Muribaculaceae bacterium]